MPFARNIDTIVGKPLLLQPHFGNGWMICNQGESFTLIDTPQPFMAELKEVVNYEALAQVLLCLVKIRLQNHLFEWAAIIARSDKEIDLITESTAANIILSKTKPRVTKHQPVWHPDFVDPGAQPYVRGFGILNFKAQPR